MNDQQFLQWIHNRLEEFGDYKNIDFMKRLRRIIKGMESVAEHKQHLEASLTQTPDEVHNPEEISQAMLQPNDGWRFLSKAEVKVRQKLGKRSEDIQLVKRRNGKWADVAARGGHPVRTYRTKKPVGYFLDAVPITTDREHNPENVTLKMLEPDDGWRFLSRAEVKVRKTAIRKFTKDIQMCALGGTEWLTNEAGGDSLLITYRTKRPVGYFLEKTSYIQAVRDVYNKADHMENIEVAEALSKEGWEFSYSESGYSIKLHGKFISGAGVDPGEGEVIQTTEHGWLQMALEAVQLYKQNNIPKPPESFDKRIDKLEAQMEVVGRAHPKIFKQLRDIGNEVSH